MQNDYLTARLIDLFESLYRTHRLGGKSPLTSHQYRCYLRHMDRYLGHDATVGDLTDENLAGAMQRLADKGLSRVTCNKLRHHVVALWNFLARKRIAVEFPTLRPWPEDKDAPQAWTRVQLFRLFEALRETPGWICGLPSGEWHTLHHHVLWYSAERIRASLSIRVSDCNFETGWVLVRAKHRKGGTRSLMFRLPKELLPQFRKFVARDPDREYLFPLDCVYIYVFQRYRKILKRAGLPSDRRSLYHRMRRSAISHFKQAGGNATRFAGHSNEMLTRECYEDPTICPETQGADLLFRMDIPPGKLSDDGGPRAA